MRRIAIAGALIAFTFCLAVSVLWLIEARQAKAVIGGWNGRPIANRLVFTDAAAEIGGFPFGLDIRISQAVLTMVDSQTRCQAPPLRAHSAIWCRNRFEYETAGRFECRSSGGDEIAIEVPVLHGSVHIAEEALRSATL